MSKAGSSASCRTNTETEDDRTVYFNRFRRLPGRQCFAADTIMTTANIANAEGDDMKMTKLSNESHPSARHRHGKPIA